jgi:hypothetical protein
MPLNSYFNHSPSKVIDDDRRDPHVSWEHHLVRTKNDPGGPRGGVDIVAEIGTPVLAPTDGVMHHVPDDGGAGNSCRFRHDANPGWADVFSHLSRYAGFDGQHFREGEVVAFTGDTGGVPKHLHRHLLDPDGVRRNPWDQFSVPTAQPKRQEDIVFRIVNPIDPGDNALYALSDSGHWVKIANTADLLLLQKFRAGDVSDINKAQVTTIRRYMQRLSPSAPPFDVQAFAAAVAKKVAGRVMNTADVETSINEAIDEQLPDPSADAVEVDPLQ